MRRLRWYDDLVGVASPRLNLNDGGFVTGRLLESRMATNGVIFSDGMEDDFLAFDAGAIVEIGTAEHSAMLATPHPQP